MPAKTAESREHRALVSAMEALDAAVRRELETSSPASMGRLLMDVLAALAEHRAASEGSHGILSEFDVSHGRCECVTAAMRGHRALEHEARELTRMLARSAAPRSARLEAFANGLRAHAVLLGELRMASHNLDLGVGD
jgi:hypothetical protein